MSDVLRDRKEINATFIEEKNRSDFEDFSAADSPVPLCKEKSSIDEQNFPSRNAAVISLQSLTPPAHQLSPMMQQWQTCKNQAKGALLLFRLGDFYEAFHDDAAILSKELELTLTKRQEVPMSGIPFHASEGYIDRLISRGFKVAIAEQIEEPQKSGQKGLVRREIVRIVTPGTLVQSGLLQDKKNHFLVSLTRLNSIFGLAILDLSTGEMKALELEEDREVLDELFRLQPRELIVSEKCLAHHKEALEKFSASANCLCQSKEEWTYDHRTAYDTLARHFRVQSLDGFGLKGMTAAVNAAGALLHYVHDELNLSIDHIAEIRPESLGRYMSIDRTTRRHLELTEALHDPSSSYTLLGVLDQTRTPMGGRLLREWLLHPLLDASSICERQEAISSLLHAHTASLSRQLAQIRDLERLIMRISSGCSNPRDVLALRLSLEVIPALSQSLKEYKAPLLQRALLELKDVAEISSWIASTLSDEPPVRLSDGGAIRAGVDPELDALKQLQNSNTDWIIAYQALLREQTGIKTLKVNFTRAFGYYIEVSRGQADKMPEGFIRRQTLVNAERFISPELKNYEHKILTAEEKIAALESTIFQKLREKILTKAADIRAIAKAVAQIDCLVALAEVAERRRYVRPVLDESTIFRIEKGRHPVIETSLSEGHFVPNDTLLNEERRLLLITGPNMAGKSTYIRQNALLAIMAQMGSFVPAQAAHIGIIDKVFSRIGASDDLARGQSTFMVEMSETANILHNATSKSLVVLDEIGRGTSTYDGIAIAWAVAEYLLTTPERQAKTLFATHYSELNAMEGLILGAATCNVAVHETTQGIAFLHKILPGGTDRSYGIHVAKLAGLPYPAIKKAEEMLAKMEKNPPTSPTSSRKTSKQLDLFAAVPPEEALAEAIASELRTLDPDIITPLDALALLTRWKKRQSHGL